MKFCANSLCAFHTEAGDNNCLDWDIGHKRVQVRQLRSNTNFVFTSPSTDVVLR